jgi:3-O-methylgallate 3,4-dioxygenase
VFDFGEAVMDAIESWPSDKTVAIIGSGGLSHFIVDEELDKVVIDAFNTDIDKLRGLDERLYQSGSSEIKNWVPVAVAMRRLGAKMTLVDYVPCYRSPAGNGHAMAFAYWRPEAA